MLDRLHRLDLLERAYDGPIPPARIAEALGHAPPARNGVFDRLALDAVSAIARRRRRLAPDKLAGDPDILRWARDLHWARSAAAR